MAQAFFVYILASRRNGTLYIGVTNNLARRMAEHKSGLVPGFTRQHQIDLLVYFEQFVSVLAGAYTRTCDETLASRLEG